MKGYSLKRIIAVLVVLVLSVAACIFTVSFDASAGSKIVISGATTKTQTLDLNAEVEQLLEVSNYFVVAKAKQFGGSHYAYTDALAEMMNGDDLYRETTFNKGSQLVLLSLIDRGNGKVDVFETVMLESKMGVIRDPDVSADGTKALFSMKTSNTDDFHIYELDMTESGYPYKQLTFGSGHSDIEPKYLPNGGIVFSSNRDVQTVDCWHTTVCNNYIMNGDGTNILRVGYDQVHTTYPTVCSDGRVIYTRWDYNDRTQMWVQGFFQMNQDGTNQTEVFGNGSNFPTTLLHTREVEGEPGVYVSVVSGHHVQQIGKLCLVDTNKGRNDKDAVIFVTPGETPSTNGYVDGYGQNGKVYKYPYAISKDLFLVSTIDGYSNSSSAFDIVLMNARGKSVTLVEGTSELPASQIVPVKITSNHNRPTLVNYKVNSGTYYVANVYEGPAMEGVKQGSAAYLRVVEIVYRASAIGATFQSGSGSGDPFSPIATGTGSWDVKSVLGIVPVEKDGSVMFSVPSDTPLYFQLLDKDGQVIQTMRSWSTLMPGETYSCVGCHEDKNTAPNNSNGITDAMKKGVQKLQPDLWMADVESYEGFDPYKDDSIGFSFMDVVQPIFDKSCVECHSNTTESYNKIKVVSANCDDYVEAAAYKIPFSSQWSYSIAGGAVKTDYAPFGKITSTQKDINTQWNSGDIVLNNVFRVTQHEKEAAYVRLLLKYSGTITVEINGKTMYTATSATVKEETIQLTTDQIKSIKQGTNSIKITVSGGTCYVNPALRISTDTYVTEIVKNRQTWKYSLSNPGNNWYSTDFDDSTWSSAKAPFGDRESGHNNVWTGNQLYLRMEFTVDDLSDYKNGKFIFNSFYDEDPIFYINGKQVLRASGWSDNTTMLLADVDAYSILKEGKNVIAVYIKNGAGGKNFDTDISVRVVEEMGNSDAPFSLESNQIYASRMLRTYPLSYLVLTASTPSYGGNTVGGTQFIGRPNSIVNYLSSMSEPEVQTPYGYGSSTSGIIKKLREGHGNLTENEIKAIACWIDLCVPCYGTYNEGAEWGYNAERMFEEKENKRAFYDMLDMVAKKGLAGTLEKGTIEVTYKSSKKTYTNSGDGFVLLHVAEAYSNKSTVTVKLPEGKKYIAVALHGRVGESIIYVPDGTWSYTFANLTSVYPTTMRPTGAGYINNMISVRLVGEDELAEERNLALNAYDMKTSVGAFPHATASAVDGNSANAEPRNAIDGFRVNGGSASNKNWPLQSWNPGKSATDIWIKIDFGRDVKVNSMDLLLRAGTGSGTSADTHYTDAIVELSNGKTVQISLHKTSETMSFDLGGVVTSSITIKGFVKADSTGVAPITEIAVYGTEA